MKNALRFNILAFCAILAMLAGGCGIEDPFFPPFDGGGNGGGGGGGNTAATSVQLLSQPGKIYRPLLGGGDDWTVQPLNREVLLFASGRDQYNNPVGLSDDSIWSIKKVEIRCDLKDVADSVYNPGDPFNRQGFSVNGIENACLWYPTFTGELEERIGLPYSLYPEVGYPFDACRNIGCVQYPRQSATIYAEALAKYITIRIRVPGRSDGQFEIDLPGAVPQTSNEFIVNVGSWGRIDVVWSNLDQVMRYSVDVPAEWFWISGTWEITVMATGTM